MTSHPTGKHIQTRIYIQYLQPCTYVRVHATTNAYACMYSYTHFYTCIFSRVLSFVYVDLKPHSNVQLPLKQVLTFRIGFRSPFNRWLLFSSLLSFHSLPQRVSQAVTRLLQFIYQDSHCVRRRLVAQDRVVPAAHCT